MNRKALLSFFALALGCATTAYGSEFRASVGPGGSNTVSGCVPQSFDEMVGVSASMVCASGLGTISATAVSSTGHLGLEAEAVKTTFDTLPAVSSAHATLIGTVIFGLEVGQLPNDEIAVSLNLFAGGTENSTESAGISLTFDAFISGALGGQVVLNTRDGIITQCSNTFLGVADCDFASTALLTTQPILVPVGVPVNVTLDFDLVAGAGSFGPQSAIGSYLHSFDLPSGMDVFNVPSGVTVNSEDFAIADNRFGSIESAETPEPSTLGFCALGLLGLALVRRNRAKRV